MANDLERACGRNLALERQANEQGRMIQESAERELLRINSELRSIRPGSTLLDPSLAGRYHQLVTDRAQLLTHITG